MTPWARGIGIAVVTAVISGVAVFLNAKGVRAVGEATVYTTAKNLVAAVVLIPVALALPRGQAGRGARLPRSPGVLAATAAVGVIGGSVPFVLFFEGLARESSTHAAFLQKTLVIWVALLAVPLLGERLGAPHVAAVALLVAGQAVADGGLAGLRIGTGETLILAATLLWAVEVIVVKRLLGEVPPVSLGAARMVLGSLLLLAWAAVSGRWSTLAGLDAEAWTWAAATGLVLAGYVACWYSALSLAPAVDVTAVLSVAALVTAALAAADTGLAPSATETGGLAMLLTGAVLVVLAGTARRRTPPDEAAA
ncbi:DMT family transporter [Spirillospora albida]|uniref:DMT family transporter n=1 Tax=Spirillospora albida TaxID=58123 RepID=UPI0004C20C81|nr:DMT family transporter [Spirillospora albida]